MKPILFHQFAAVAPIIGNYSLATLRSGVSTGAQNALQRRWRQVQRNVTAQAGWGVYAAAGVPLHAFLNGRGPVGLRWNDEAYYIVTSGSDLMIAALGIVTVADGNNAPDGLRGLGFTVRSDGLTWRAFLGDDSGAIVSTDLGVDATVPHTLAFAVHPRTRRVWWEIDNEIKLVHELTGIVGPMDLQADFGVGYALHTSGTGNHSLRVQPSMTGVSLWYDAAPAVWGPCDTGGDGSWAEN